MPILIALVSILIEFLASKLKVRVRCVRGWEVNFISHDIQNYETLCKVKSVGELHSDGILSTHRPLPSLISNFRELLSVLALWFCYGVDISDCKRAFVVRHWRLEEPVIEGFGDYKRGFRPLYPSIQSAVHDIVRSGMDTASWIFALMAFRRVTFPLGDVLRLNSLPCKIGVRYCTIGLCLVRQPLNASYKICTTTLPAKIARAPGKPQAL